MAAIGWISTRMAAKKALTLVSGPKAVARWSLSFFSICRIRSRVTPYRVPSSSRVTGFVGQVAIAQQAALPLVEACDDGRQLVNGVRDLDLRQQVPSGSTVFRTGGRFLRLLRAACVLLDLHVSYWLVPAASDEVCAISR